jgi:hypothetical protein
MKKAIFSLLLVAAFGAHAEYHDEPFKMFDATKRVVDKSTITWVKVNDVDKACNAESHRRGNGGFKVSMYACSFWDQVGNQTVCTIITGNQTNLAEVGHEVRHCFQGSWHGY